MSKLLLMTRISLVTLAFGTIVSLAAVSLATADDSAAGRAVFDAQKCATCHSVAAAGIEAKAKSEKLKGPDLGGVTERHERAWIEQYVRKQIEFNGAAHKKEFKGTDEELAALIDWLATFPCAEDSSAAASSAAASASPVSDLPATVRADR